MLKYGLFFCWVLLSTITVSPDPMMIRGAWAGELTQKNGGYAEVYSFELYINVEGLEEGEFISGRSYIYAKNAFGEMSFTGYVVEDKLVIEEKELLYSDKPGMLSWCYKTMDLELLEIEGEWFLQGNWEAESRYGNCIPGRVKLQKIIPQV